ncbi:hypothetical protein ALTERO38_50822 [Alteromonas sp. 38]|uniref:hypothetical protein n=1 Tax=Alteromonas TaxID=226 RepID=UPI0012EFFBBF|nr:MULTISPECIES: hypothetical protein [Alteromonas]CAD5282954.1 hypothetical protein ALTER154_80444 [Alteromonas sp. 154]VXB49789.1 hypothetical protein ALTERO38_50822 [Alteromonas sp. 38]
MKLRVLVSFFIFTSLSFLVGCRDQSVEFQSACFNNEPNPKKVGVWMYQAGSWQDGRKESSEWFALGYESGAATLQREELLYCFFVFGDLADEMSICKNGELNILSATDTELKGNYNLKLESGLELRGVFNASYCAPE